MGDEDLIKDFFMSMFWLFLPEEIAGKKIQAFGFPLDRRGLLGSVSAHPLFCNYSQLNLKKPSSYYSKVNKLCLDAMHRYHPYILSAAYGYSILLNFLCFYEGKRGDFVPSKEKAEKFLEDAKKYMETDEKGRLLIAIEGEYSNLSEKLWTIGVGYVVLIYNVCEIDEDTEKISEEIFEKVVGNIVRETKGFSTFAARGEIYFNEPEIKEKLDKIKKSLKDGTISIDYAPYDRYLIELNEQ